MEVNGALGNGGQWGTRSSMKQKLYVLILNHRSIQSFLYNPCLSSSLKLEWVLVCSQEGKIHPAMLKEVFQRPKTGNDTEIDRRGDVSARDDPSRWSETNNTLLMQIMLCFGASFLCYRSEKSPLPKTGTIVEFSFRCYSSHLPIVQYLKQLFHIIFLLSS